MAFAPHRHPAFRRLQERRTLAALAASLMLGGCGQVLNPGASDLLSLSNPQQSQSRQAQANEPAQSADDLRKATEYWGDAFAKNPRDLKTALSYARNLKAMGEKRRAIAVLQQASIFHGDSRELAGEYGRLALDLDQIGVAKQLLAGADDPSRPDWRIVSARGTVLAKEGKYDEAIPFYERALTLAHDQPSLLSNLALAYAMNGEPARAEAMLRQASAADSTSPRIRQNLALVLGLQGKYDEAKLVAARDLAVDRASDNADYLRQVVKLDPKNVPNSEAGTQVAAWTTEQKPETAAAPVHAVQKLAQAPADDAAAGDEDAVVDTTQWATAQTKGAAASRTPGRKAAAAKPKASKVAEAAPKAPKVAVADAGAAQWTSMLSTTPKKAEPIKPQPKTLSVAELAATLGQPAVAQPEKASASKPAATAKAAVPGNTAAADDGQSTKKAEPAQPQPKTLSVAELAAALGQPAVAQPEKASASKPAATAKAAVPGNTAAADDGQSTKKAEPAQPQPKTLSVAELAAALGQPAVAQPEKASTSKPAAAAEAAVPGKTAAVDDGEALSWAPLAAQPKR